MPLNSFRIFKRKLTTDLKISSLEKKSLYFLKFLFTEMFTMKSIMTNLEFLTEWKIWSHPYSFSSLICSPLLCWVRLNVRREPGEISASAQSCWFFPDYQSKEKCHTKEMTGDPWTDDLISSEPEIWTLHQWHHHWEITDQRRSRASLGTGGDWEGQGSRASSTRSIFSSADQMAWGGRWAATAWSGFLLP